jgi:hypothetical protein
VPVKKSSFVVKEKKSVNHKVLEMNVIIRVSDFAKKGYSALVFRRSL